MGQLRSFGQWDTSHRDGVDLKSIKLCFNFDKTKEYKEFCEFKPIRVKDNILLDGTFDKYLFSKILYKFKF